MAALIVISGFLPPSAIPTVRYCYNVKNMLFMVARINKTVVDCTNFGTMFLKLRTFPLAMASLAFRRFDHYLYNIKFLKHCYYALQLLYRCL